MRVVRIAASCIGLLTTVGTLPSMAADVSTPFIQQEAARADASLRQRAEAPMTGAASLRHIVITSSEPVFRKYKNRLEAYEHNRIGSDGVTFLQKQLQEQLLADGYVTSQVVVPNQDLHSGSLTFEILPGYVEDIVLTNPNARTNWRSAFPVRPGYVLRRQALEQGIDQMRSVPGQDIKMTIEPGTKPLYSIVKLTVEQKGFVHGSFILDNSGYKATGEYQGTVFLSFSQLLGLNDTLTANFTKDISPHDDGHGSKQYAVNYAIPDGNRTYRLSTYKYSYNQLVFMPNAFRSAGTTQGTEVSVEQVLNRTSRSKTSVIAKVNHKSRHNYLDDVEIGVQEQHTTSVELGLSHRQYRGNTVSDTYVFYRQGIKGLGAKVRSWEGLADNPTTLYKMAGVEGQIQTGVRIGHKQGIFSMRFRSQFTNQRLFTSVRGFSGEETLRGDSGYYVQSEWSLPFRKQQITPYIGIDIGHVWGPSTETQLGNTLIGGVVGVRGTVGEAVNYDVSLGTPIKKPEGFNTDTRVWAFRGSYQF
ncbi:MAG: ShlB/FhaC/HecB family hemolysin secretion/activation protein [Veillonella sp.]|nr:ShlB/FhaC/HecB family hemolysin secretion/activation protein [Veillonella sp.]